MWQTEIELLSRQNYHLSRPELAKLLFNHLESMFASVEFYVIVYDDVTGGDKHFVQGYDMYYLFRHYGNNIVVFRLIHPRNRGEPNDLPGSFLKAYEPRFDGTHIDAEKTLQQTWNNMPAQGVAPWNLFILRDGISYAWYRHFNARTHSTTLPSDKGLACIVGEKY